MKTKNKKELRDEEIARYLWNKKRDVILPMSLFVAIIAVSIWKWDRLFVDFYTFAKIFVTAIGIGYCLGNNLCYLLFQDKESMIANARSRHHQRYQTFWMKYLQKEEKKLPKKIQLQKDKFEVERIMLRNEFDL